MVPIMRRPESARGPTALYVTAHGNDSVGVFVVFKAASRSMVKGRAQHASRNGPTPEEMHVFVREPIERLESAYRFFGGRPPIDYLEDGEISWERFIDLLLDEGKENPHWRSAADTLKLAGRSHDTIVHLFEDVNKAFPLGKLDRRNESKRDGRFVTDPTYREAELREMYADDYALRKRAI